MDTLSMLTGAFLLPGGAILLMFRLLRGRLGEMPRLLWSSLLGYAAFAVGTALVGRSMDAPLPRDWSQSGLLFSGIWATFLIVWAADEGRDLAPQDRTPPDHWPTGLLGRHWRGDVPLWGAFWIVGLWLTPLLVAFARANVAALDLDLSIDEPAFERASWGFTVFTVALVGWSLRGLWKSSRRAAEASRGRALRRLPALTVAGLSAFGLVVLAVVAIGLAATAVHRYWFDPDVERLADIRVVRGGREITIDGYFSPGIARRFGLVLLQAPKARVVHLNSFGGSMDEAYRLAILIHRRRLDTYVAEQCYSACSLTFTAGRRRWVGPEALIGFHAPAIGLLQSLGVPHGAIQRKLTDDYYRNLGVDDGLIARIRTTPFEHLLTLFPVDLLDYGFATEIVDTDRFAASGWQIYDWNSAAKALKDRFAILEEVEKLHPEKFEAIVEKFRIAYEAGTPPSEIFSSLRPFLDEIIEMSVERATDELMRD